MSDFIIRPATVDDAPFLAKTIIEAEKSGTNKLSYATIFGLSEEDVHRYLIDMLEEEIDGCELSVSSYLVAESNGQVVAAVGAWVEGNEDMPSAIIKANLLKYTLPKECIEKAMNLNRVLREVNIEILTKTIYLTGGFVAKEFRGNRLLGTLMTEITERLLDENPEVVSACTHVFGSNIPSLKTCEKLGFVIFGVDFWFRLRFLEF